MIKVYIAGPYSSDNVLGVLANIRAGMRMATKLLQHGFAVFCPWADHQLFLQLREGEEISIETIQAASMEWLKASDVVLVLHGYHASKGTLAEMRMAYTMDKPVFFNPCELYQWADKEKASEYQRA